MNIGHAEKAKQFIVQSGKVDWHNETLWGVRKKRDAAVREVEAWENLRASASSIKEHVLSNLETYLLEFERQAIHNGVHVHWARNADEHNRIIGKLLETKRARKVVKSKSMLTEECGLNVYLEKKGIEVIDTDLGERIVQLNNDTPSHIVLPAVHLRKEEVSNLFHEKLHTEKGNSNPAYLTRKARASLRKNFLNAEASITGVNFAIAETGGIVICTNEGNADMGVHASRIQIHAMGIEKIIPKASHLGIFTRLLARSATGQPITVYTSHYHRPQKGKEMHVVIVDNGRSDHLARPSFRNGLKCIRCGACMNTCPVYRRSGGHSYGAPIPGPIGSILNPRVDLNAYSDLPFASTLCGSCTDVCPVKIDIHDQLYTWRKIVTKTYPWRSVKKLVMRLLTFSFVRPRLYNWQNRVLRWKIKKLPRFLIYNSLNRWGMGRELPSFSNETFREWFEKNRGFSKKSKKKV